ncbi:hypothetical protein N7470_009443 [Penicillium chermesinum]|nr:hypothetical protein N7470_009443 [Penicillium chermesinum]
MENLDKPAFGPYPPPKQFVLCFDGTGNKFAGDASDTNIVKIYRMLDRSQGYQYHYYQPGIGTYVTSHSLGSKGRIERIRSSYKKAKDAALGSSFDEHVLGGYKFLMRYYAPGDDIYFFGFSRGSYTARFLAEMLDFIGLLQPGNEELVRFAWKTFAKWQQRKDSTDHDHVEKHKLFQFMKAFRETFSRPVSRVKFMGLFDTVNSVPMFENAWMERNKFPYTAHSTARVIRHAVSIDERRAKGSPRHQLRTARKLKNLIPGVGGDEQDQEKDQKHDNVNVPQIERYRAYSPSPRRPSINGPHPNGLVTDQRSLKSAVSGTSLQIPLLRAPGPDEDEEEQDIAEVWFPGQHGDVGGGWKLNPEDKWPLSHIPLVWMIREAQHAGLDFDPEKLKRFNCYEDPTLENLGLTEQPGMNGATTPPGELCRDDPFHDTLKKTMDHGIVHDCLTYRGGLSVFSTLAWRLMEYLPFRRMDLQSDGSWKPIRWPLPCGEPRDIPDNAQIHICAIHRMQVDTSYRPGNLIIGGGGRGVKRASDKYGIGQWEVCKHEGDLVRQTYTRKKTETACVDDHL